MKLFYWVAVPMLIYGVLNKLFYTWLPSQYVFDPKVLQALAKESIQAHPGDNTTEIITDLIPRIKKEYGDKAVINDLNWEEWVFNNAGGSMGNMFIIHSSISEYLIIFGSAISTNGHSGVHFADDYFTILSGNQKVAYENQVECSTFFPGDCNHLKRGQVTQFSMDGGSYALELAQGWIPAMLPFGFVEVISSTLDFTTFGKTCYYTAREMFRNLAQGKF